MKKIAILLFAVLLISTTYNAFASTSETKTNKEEKSSAGYRVEEEPSTEHSIEKEENLITETEVADEEEPITEEELTTYIETVDTEVTEITTKEILTSEEKKVLTNTFITLTDFIFYGGEIRGTTFVELTEEAKLHIIYLYEKIDAKIESVYPGYKEKIKETSIKTYNDVMYKLIDLKETTLARYKEEVGEERYNEQVELFNIHKEAMKETLTPVIEKAIDDSLNFYERTKSRLDIWYRTWKEENS